MLRQEENDANCFEEGVAGSVFSFLKEKENSNQEVRVLT